MKTKKCKLCNRTCGRDMIFVAMPKMRFCSYVCYDRYKTAVEKRYNKAGRLVYFRTAAGYEEWNTYDHISGELIYKRVSGGYDG